MIKKKCGHVIGKEKKRKKMADTSFRDVEQQRGNPDGGSRNSERATREHIGDREYMLMRILVCVLYLFVAFLSSHV